jgi:ubiquinone/menaquinone biosynthesis C-methylase UbiE
MSNKFNLQAEKKYYKDLPSDQLQISEVSTVEFMLQLCTNSLDWPTLMDQHTVLEVGAGGCSFIHHFLKKATPRLYIAADIFVERMHAPKSFGNYPQVAYLGSDVLNLPIKDGSVDLCLAFGLLHHIPNLDEALAEIARVLKVGGALIFRDPWAGNPLVRLKYLFEHKSRNEFPLTRKRIKASLAVNKLNLVNLKVFWLRFPKIFSGPWSTNIGGIAIRY